MKSSYLVQRLNAPLSGLHASALERLSFGGGLLNGGLSEDAMRILRKIFSFDYMGAAEFEFGALPKALNGMAQNVSLYKAYSIEVTTSKGNEATIFIITRPEWIDQNKKDIKAWTSDPYRKDTTVTKERVGLNLTIDGDEWTQGWLEINNGFFFFYNYEMAVATAKLFGISIEEW